MTKKPKTCPNHPERLVKAKGLCGSCYHRYLDEIAPQDILEARLEKRRQARRGKYISPEIRKNRVLKSRYGIDLGEYRDMIRAQGNKCACCGKKGGSTKGTQLYVDHNHSTGKVRELLCAGCNMIVGSLESPKLEAAMKYLHKHDTAE